MDKKGFLSNGQFYKGNLHSHTTVSDGILEVGEAVTLYKNQGYDFMCISDHDIYSDYREQYDCESFIMLPGIEYSAVLYQDESRTKRQKIHHLHGILGTKEMQKNAAKPLLSHLQYIQPMHFVSSWDGSRVAQKMADMLMAHGLFTTYNHPIWSRVSESEFIDTKGLCMLEIFNYNTVQESNTGYDVTYWDRMLRMGKHIYGFAADDNHNEGLFEDSCGGWVCVKAESLTHENIVKSLMNGDFYSSSGPSIYDFGVKDGVAYVECSPVNHINFVSGNIINDGTTILGRKFEDDLGHAENRLKGHETYVRIECVDKYGRCAWTNPIWIDW